VAQEFSQIVRTQQADKFDEWVVGAEASGIPEVGSFVAGLLRDKAAVVAALSLPYSSGQVEGQITRVKLLKHTMYGRANFDLLRQRVLARTASTAWSRKVRVSPDPIDKNRRRYEHA
jgi:transposase